MASICQPNSGEQRHELESPDQTEMNPGTALATSSHVRVLSRDREREGMSPFRIIED